MHRFTSSKQVALCGFSLLLAGASLAIGGCLGSYEACPEDQRVTIDPSEARIWPPVVHTGYNGRDTFLAPISTNYVVDDWQSSTPQVVSVSGYSVCGTPSIYEPSGLLAAEGPGTAQVSARTTGIDMSVEVIVTEYTEADTDLGYERYHTSDPGNMDRVSCASCHEAAGGVDHTPLEMAFHDDAALLAATQDSRYPSICTDQLGADCDCSTGTCANETPGYELLEGQHAWDLTDQEEIAIVAYMRSLRPRGI